MTLQDRLRGWRYLSFIRRDEVMAELDRLTAENEALRKDALRYRWLRDECVDNEPMVEGDSYWVRSVHFEFSSTETLDVAIDAAK